MKTIVLLFLILSYTKCISQADIANNSKNSQVYEFVSAKDLGNLKLVTYSLRHDTILAIMDKKIFKNCKKYQVEFKTEKQTQVAEIFINDIEYSFVYKTKSANGDIEVLCVKYPPGPGENHNTIFSYYRNPYIIKSCN
ncbi:hypothetical protein [Flavobacterium silvaticum]|uniref:Uncharacterized protein n=1 Tax=Flavobacterium silvaticum TaxID=1852020 RepID=A0A972FID1_9FLAO|nr:hypothetical protein [Flavobacterium silvaticum]NMH26544.1 hypothetical protein [Flavobacterium silvaticum]